jgi:2-keto-4-pentenoate hydratase/2-oxohepta-3-ene-1,7-dioic acid hydratase in catechol pathway
MTSANQEDFVRLALFDDYRLGVVSDDETTVADVTTAIADHDSDPLTAGWWRRMCRDWKQVAPTIAELAATGHPRDLREVTLRAPAMNPSKVIAAASNYAAHVEEMRDVQERTLGTIEEWMMQFDVFLKAPSSISDPGQPIVLPPSIVAAGNEIHHESELVIVVGTGGFDISRESALDHVMGFTAGLDITVRSPADRSRRKSYNTFSPLGPWIRTTEDGFDASSLEILLTVDTEVRQHVNTKDLIVDVAGIVSYASKIMTLAPGDIIFTGAPPGVGPILSGEILDSSISGIGHLVVPVA